MAEIDTFDEMTEAIEGYIRFGVKPLASKAISRKLITRQEQRRINGITDEFDQATHFMELFAQKITNDATVMNQFVEMLREVSTYDKLVKEIEDKLVEKRIANAPPPPVEHMGEQDKEPNGRQEDALPVEL